MDGKGRWGDNIFFIERFGRTLKYEEVYIKSYVDVKDCQNNLKEFFEKYNNRRLHESLGCQNSCGILFWFEEGWLSEMRENTPY